MTVWNYRNKADETRWAYKFERGGKQYKSIGYLTQKAAKDAEAKRLAEVNNPPPQPPPTTPSTSFLEISTAYLEQCKARMQLNTWRAKQRYFKAFLAWHGSDLPASECSPGMIGRYLLEVQQEHGAKRANRDLKDLKALFTWAIRQGEYHLTANPAANLDAFPEDPSVKYVPPAEDIDAVLMAADQEEMDLLIVLYHTGGRIGEIRRLKWEDVNLEKRTITLWTRKRRGGQLQEDKQPLGESLLELLRRRWRDRDKQSIFVFHREDGSAHTKDGRLRRLMATLCSRAGVKPFGFHAIRHHVASILADSGKATLGQIQKFLRHRRPTTTELYLHEVTRDQQEVAEILEEKREGGGLGIKPSQEIG